MSNHEKKNYADAVDLYLALSRTKDGQEARCIRTVIKNPDEDLAVLEARVRLLGGKWRIHKTVNQRDTEKARKLLLHKLIDLPERRGDIDSLWRTCLLDPSCIYGEKKFLLDVDTKELEKLNVVRSEIIANFIAEVETENGWHFIMMPFDTREACKLDYVHCIRDGYVYVKTVNS